VSLTPADTVRGGDRDLDLSCFVLRSAAALGGGDVLPGFSLSSSRDAASFSRVRDGGDASLLPVGRFWSVLVRVWGWSWLLPSVPWRVEALLLSRAVAVSALARSADVTWLPAFVCPASERKQEAQLSPRDRAMRRVS